MPNNIAAQGKAILEATHSQLLSKVQGTADKHTEVAKKWGRDIINEFFDGANGSRWIDTIQTHANVTGGNTSAVISITVEATDDVGTFAVDAWRRRHHGLVPPGNVWVSYLIWENGEIALPQYASVWDSEHPGNPYNGPGWSNSCNLRYPMFTRSVGLKYRFEAPRSEWQAAAEEIRDEIAASVLAGL